MTSRPPTKDQLNMTTHTRGTRSASAPSSSPLLDLPRITCSTGCGTELMPRPDRRHVDNLLDAGWTCTACRRSASMRASFDDDGTGHLQSTVLSPREAPSSFDDASRGPQESGSHTHRKNSANGGRP